MEKLKDQVKPDALSRIKSSLVLEQIVTEEKIVIFLFITEARVTNGSKGFLNRFRTVI